jgi:tetratricopeptide (TPR) repeat protein
VSIDRRSGYFQVAARSTTESAAAAGAIVSNMRSRRNEVTRSHARMRYRILAVASLVAGSALGAQSAAEQIAIGDSIYARFKPDESLPHYIAAIGSDSSNYEALWKAARTEIDLAEAERDEARRDRFSKSGEALARRAIRVNSQDAEAHFHLARALGRRALTVGVRDRVKFGTAVRDEALEALRLNPNHPGALHVMGVWNAEVMRLNSVQRFFAKNVLGGRVFGEASWDKAVSYMERSVAVDPERIVHHLDLGKIYADLGNKAKAREQFEMVVRGRRIDFSDPAYQREAKALLEKLTG